MIPITRSNREEIINWLEMTEQGVLDKFAELPNAKKVGEKDEQFVFIEGTRKDKVVLVAHADTVHMDHRKSTVDYKNGVFFSKDKKVGIGADDRAGCFILWQLRESGHSLLIPNGEESGCVGSRFLSKHKTWKELINSHKFAIQFDRRHNSDLVFYSVGSKNFVKWCEENFKGYKEQSGSFTDIATLCDPMCGVNLSVGYYNEHTSGEILKEVELYRTLNTTLRVISQKDIPRFEQDPKRTYNYGNYYTVGSSQNRFANQYKQFDSYDQYYQETSGVPRIKRSEQRDITDANSMKIISADRKDSKYIETKFDTIIVCPWCDMVMDEVEHSCNKNKCVGCSAEFSLLAS
jgi:hypothetical protein